MTSENTSLLNDQLVDMKFITTFTGLTDKWFYKLIQDGLFPAPIKMGRASRWLKSEVETWMKNKISASRPD
ncbi:MULTISPECIES: helix-turn-helix transcriptional regulator [Citrobacter freundii complex]|uniref:helix-turn-helix transcriptional regulator n=2 Tax=Enterobacteriaceae TaxID=543 RepID=UPI0015E97ADD|nr:AlpA family phage regulatory protein [Citrobacter freundii]QLY53833.1 AlpA family phage regulatory protein [Citrobacter freundii]